MYLGWTADGCTDETAANYNSNATIDDGSCDICEEQATIIFNVDASYVVSGDYDNVDNKWKLGFIR